MEKKAPPTSASKVSFWDPRREYEKHRTEILEAVDNCLSRGELVLGYGEEITKFEKAFAERLGVKRAVMCGSGTHALRLAYDSIGLKEGDEVITTSHTFIATINQIARTGAKPVLVDIGEDGLIDPALIEGAITERTKAIVPVHLEGKVCDMPTLLEIAEKHNLKVIEDSCQAIDAHIQGKKAGTFGDLGCFSFHPAKVLGTAGNAGMVVTNDDELADEISLARCHYNVGKHQITLESGREVEPKHGGNLKPDPIFAAILNAKLPHLTERLERRKEIAERYNKELSMSLSLPVLQEGRVWQDYVVRASDAFERKKLTEHLDFHNVGYLGDNMKPNHKYESLGLDCSLPKTEAYLETQVRIPCNPDMSDWEVSRVIEVINAFYV